MDTLKSLVSHDPIALDLLDQAIGSHQGQRTDLKDNFVDNVNEVRPDGNSSTHALRKLRKDRPDLHTRVLAGELSPHKAMREAGFRPRTATINLDNPKSAARIIAKASPEFLEELRRLLST